MAKQDPSPFLTTVKEAEERLFKDLLDPEDSSRMKNDGAYSWLYRPSHHAETGLIREGDIEVLKTGRLLSIGAAPAALERVIVELGVPAEHITVADTNPEILQGVEQMEKLHFDMTERWPEIGSYDLILFPESLCIAISDRLKGEVVEASDVAYPLDGKEAEVLARILGESLRRLKPGGEIRANGPMSHPNVVKAASAILEQRGLPHAVEYERFFLVVRPKS